MRVSNGVDGEAPLLRTKQAALRARPSSGTYAIQFIPYLSAGQRKPAIGDHRGTSADYPARCTEDVCNDRRLARPAPRPRLCHGNKHKTRTGQEIHRRRL
jgi:hypothetical protein